MGVVLGGGPDRADGAASLGVFRRSERVLRIVKAGEPVLRQKARPLTVDEIRSPQTQDLIANMRLTMRRAPGVGLAAPQVGEPLQLFVVEDQEDFQKRLAPEQLSAMERQPVPFHVVINPTLTFQDETEVEFFEGCLSVGDFRALVKRARAVCVRGLDEKAAHVELHAVGWYARILQHEYDHLQGTLYVDRMATRSFSTLENYSRFWASMPAQRVRRELDIS